MRVYRTSAIGDLMGLAYTNQNLQMVQVGTLDILKSQLSPQEKNTSKLDKTS